ncbi:SRPBCC family protein [Mycobacterium sp.]|uniref:SRPBCC family protein n=1 Tax=Mycobacterium sp. TaxID=1785 RepID=UPI003D6B3455
MTSARRGEVKLHMNASPEKIWEVLADLERMGDWSPECYRVRWLDGANSPAEKGARFKGRNRWRWMRWSMTCRVTTADPGRELSWATVRRGKEIVRWTYRLEPANGGTGVTESFEARRWPLDVRLAEDFIMRNRNEQRAQAMAATLEHIRAVVEST